tara:strand:+ start:1561 stop:1782 length:222 start_codon:yes stop_codon:yes gene_type:complete
MDKEIDFGMSVIPTWMKITMMICKWLICIIPFIITSVMFIFFKEPEMTMWDNWMLTSVYLLSLANVVNMVGND